MTDVIKVTINERHFVSCSTETIARKGEGEYPRLVIEIPNRLSGMWPYLDFKKPSGETFKTPRLAIDGNIIEYDLPLSVLNEKGTLEMQLVLQNGKGRIWKSNVKRFKVLYSIDATGDIENDEDFVDYVENMVESALKELELVCIVMELPEEGVPNKTYFVPKPDGVDNDLYDEYMWIDGAWEYFGTKTIEVDLTDYVKNTDFPDPKNFKAGVVRVDNYYGFNVGQAGSAGVLLPLWASNAEIDSKSDRRFINAKNFDYALAKSLTTNAETLTDAEKEIVQKWLGVTAATNEAKPYSFVKRSANGVIYTGTPTEGKHAATKEYVDAATPFIAEYGVTTYDEIKTAVDAGRACFCLIKDGTYKGCVVPLSYTDGVWYTFSTIVANTSPNTVGMAQELSVWCINGGTWTDIKTKALAYAQT